MPGLIGLKKISPPLCLVSFQHWFFCAAIYCFGVLVSLQMLFLKLFSDWRWGGERAESFQARIWTAPLISAAAIVFAIHALIVWLFFILTWGIIRGAPQGKVSKLLLTMVACDLFLFSPLFVAPKQEPPTEIIFARMYYHFSISGFQDFGSKHWRHMDSFPLDSFQDRSIFLKIQICCVWGCWLIWSIWIKVGF